MKINSDSTIQFFSYKSLDTIYLLDSIHFQNRSDTFDIKLYDFTFNNLVTTQIGLTLDEITGIPLSDTTILMPIPAFNRNLDKTLRINNVANGLIRTCFLNVTVINNSRLRFDSICCQLPNCDIISFDNIDSLSTVECHRYFNNVFIDSIINFNVLFSSAGTGNESILISKHDSIKFIVKFDSLRVEYGYFRSIPPRLIRTTKTKVYSMPSNYHFRINDLIFQNGQLTIDLNSFFPISTFLHCSIPELSYDTVLQLTTQSPLSLTIDLQNKHYHNESESLTPLTLKTAFEFQLDSVYVYLGQENSVVISYLINNIEIDSIAGTIIDSLQHRFVIESIPVKLPDFLQNVQAANVLAQLNIVNAIAFPIYCKLSVVGVSNIDSIVIDSCFSVTPGTPNLPAYEIFTINISRLFNFHPAYIKANITVASIGNGWMSRNSFATGSYSITAPMRVVLKADTVTFNPSTVKIGEKICKMVRDYGASSQFFAHIQNHIPAPLQCDIILQNQTLDTVLINISVPAGVIDANSGLVIACADTNIVICLDSVATKIFTDSIIQASVRIYIPTTDTITISASDYLKIADSYTQVQTKSIPK
ncbi:MAG: hypothetical protein N2748_03300 [candidate division WOR-3 bacterium]|nr:hypothetical protein [candidate division WOR-3 bacterium]